MKSLSVYDYKDYKAYILEWIEQRPNSGRGERTRFAESLQCQLGYISQVLNGSAHFSFEQAEALNTLLTHDDDESEFFILLLHLERAGTKMLRNRIQIRIKKMLDHRLSLKNRLQHEKTINEEDQMVYYSAWYYSAVHIALAIPALRTRDAISKAFSLELSKTSEILNFLVSKGLAQETRGIYSIGNARLHLQKDSPMILKHHTNWRIKAIQSLESEVENELHYSSVISFGTDDIIKIREILVKAIESVRSTIRPSPDETLFCYNLDFFRLINSKNNNG